MAEAKKKVEATKPTPEEKQAAAEAEVDALVARAKKALDEFENLDQKQVDRIVAKASIAALNKHLVLAKMAVDETGRASTPVRRSAPLKPLRSCATPPSKPVLLRTVSSGLSIRPSRPQAP